MSILREADTLVNGDRQQSYGTPLDNFTRIANTYSALMSHKLIAPLSAEDAVLFMEVVKMCREVYKPGRDNRRDGAGYWGVLDMVIEGRE